MSRLALGALRSFLRCRRRSNQPSAKPLRLACRLVGLRVRRCERVDGRPIENRAINGEARAMAGTIPALLASVPLHDAAEMRAYRGAGVHRAPLVAIDRDFEAPSRRIAPWPAGIIAMASTSPGATQSFTNSAATFAFSPMNEPAECSVLRAGS